MTAEHNYSKIPALGDGGRSAECRLSTEQARCWQHIPLAKIRMASWKLYISPGTNVLARLKLIL